MVKITCLENVQMLHSDNKPTIFQIEILEFRFRF